MMYKYSFCFLKEAFICEIMDFIHVILIYASAQCRMLVYEFVNNGNLEQWLHGEVGPYSPLTWEIRMNIILGTAKGYV